MALLPIVLTCTKPSKTPQILNSIGDHLKKKRIEQNLTQLDLAKLIGVEEDTICNWENNHSQPRLFLLPKIIEFLRYVPFELPKETIGDKIIAYRKEHGLSQRKFAKLLSIDQTTVRNWENNKHKPDKKLLKKILLYLEKNFYDIINV